MNSHSPSFARLERARRVFSTSHALLALAWALALSWGSTARAEIDWESSVVTVEVTSKAYDAFQPWNDPTRAVRKHGLVIGPDEILATAQYLPTHTLVRLQKSGRGRWYDARVKWWDAQSNLALITTDAPAFWVGLTPAKLATRASRGPEFELLRWRDGNLETRRVEFGQFTVAEGLLGFAPYVQLEIATDIGGLGWGEPVVQAGEILGLTTHSNGRVCGVLPATFIRRVLDARRDGKFNGLGYFDFTWQPGRNPELLQELGLDGPPRGAVIQSPGHETDPAKAPQARDIILEVGGFAIDGEGDYLDPEFGHLMLENLANRTHFAGDVIPIKLRRGSQDLTLDYTIPPARFADELVPREIFGAPPTYLMAGGLVFQPLAQPFLRGWGDEWRKYSPFRLQYYMYSDSPDRRPSLVVLTGVLPDAINLGYQDAAMTVLDQVNGHKISTLKDLAAALLTPSAGGVHRFEFMRGRDLQRLLLDAGTLEEATRRVVEHYGLPAASRL